MPESPPPPPAERHSLRPRRPWRLALPSLAVAGGLGALEFLRRYLQARQTFQPAPFPRGEWGPEEIGLPIEDVWFRAEDGVALHGWWMRHPAAQGTLLCCHGHSGSIAHRIDLYHGLRHFRMNLLAFDYRGYGRSGGTPSEKGLFRDVRAAYDTLVGDLGEAAERVVLFGQSLGGAVAIDGALHRPVAGLVVQSSFIDLKAMARNAYPHVPLHVIARNQFRNLGKVEELAVPKLFVHGAADPRIPPSHSRALYARARAPKELLVVPGAGHHDVHLAGGRRYFWCVARFLLGCLKPVSTPGA